MISRASLQESDRFNTKHPDLCPALRWKAQFILSRARSDRPSIE